MSSSRLPLRVVGFFRLKNNREIVLRLVQRTTIHFDGLSVENWLDGTKRREFPGNSKRLE